jgi:O-antigen/teichoic acid export membrane protein
MADAQLPSLKTDGATEFDTLLSPPAMVTAEQQGLLARGKRVAEIVGQFLLGQGAAQIINMAAGFLLVHRLSVEAYAQFGVATAFQSVFTILMDLGFAATIVPLVGDRGNDPVVVGKYVRAARHLRDRTFLLLTPVACICFLATVRQRHWSLRLQLLLLASVLLSLYSSGVVSFFSAPLLILGRLREYYLPQAISGGARLCAYAVLGLTGGLSAGSAALLGALNITLNGTLIRRASLKHMRWPAHDDAAIERELLRYVLPAIPAILFSALQSQITLFLISIFGGTLYLAEVAALGRIGGVFLVLTTVNTVVVEPYVARLKPSRLPRAFAGISLLAALLMTPVVLVGFLWPQPILWVLGAKYVGLRPLLGWYLLSASMNFVSGLIWVMNRARKWVFWSGSILEVSLLLGTQIAFLALVGVKTTHQAVMFSLASSGCYMIAHGYVTARGFFLSRTATLG